MIKRYLDNPIMNSLLKNSYLSETQVDILLCRKNAEVNGMKIVDSIKLRDKFTTFGSFDRSYKQASVVIRRCILTLLLIDLLQLSSDSFLYQLTDLSKLLKSVYMGKSDSTKEIEGIINDFVSGIL